MWPVGFQGRHQDHQDWEHVSLCMELDGTTSKEDLPEQTKVSSLKQGPWVAIRTQSVVASDIIGPVAVVGIAPDGIEEEVDAVVFDQCRCFNALVTAVVRVVDLSSLAVESVSICLQRL